MDSVSLHAVGPTRRSGCRASAAPRRCVSERRARGRSGQRDGREALLSGGNDPSGVAVRSGVRSFRWARRTVLFDQPYFHGLGGQTWDSWMLCEVTWRRRCFRDDSSPTSECWRSPLGIVVVRTGARAQIAVKFRRIRRFTTPRHRVPSCGYEKRPSQPISRSSNVRLNGMVGVHTEPI